MRRRRRKLMAAVALLPVGKSPARQVGVCGSCGGAVMLDPDAAHAECGCGDCKLPRAFLRYGERA